MIVINGEPAPDAAGRTLAQWLEGAGLRADRVAVEIDGEIVRRADYAGRVLVDGERLEIVHFMGGG